MARSLTLTPTRVEGRKTPWRIWIPARLNSTGKDGDRYYATKREAEQAAAAIEIRKENFGRLGTTLSESQIAIAGKAFQLLGDRDPVALIEIIRRQLQGEERLVAIGGATMEDAIQAHITAENRLLPYFIFTFLEGIRPDGEILKLEWKHVHQAGKHPEIVVEPSVAKTGRRRFVPIPKNARAWLEAYRQHGGVMEGLIVTYGREALREHRRKAQGAANIKTWIQSGARHSFCSYWLAEHKGDVNKLVLISGHDDPDTMLRHYHRGTTEAEAHKFWSILPPVELPNVIAMKKVRKTA